MGTLPALSNSNHLDLLEWLKVNCLGDHQIQVNGILWSTLFPFAIWEIWKHRNKVIFENTPPNLHLHSTCTRLATEYFYCAGKTQTLKHYTTTPVCWSKLMEGWYKLNLDWASLGNPGKAGGGGLIRDSQGSLVKGNMRNIGVATNVKAEFWALRDGLLLASHMGIAQLVMER